MSNEPNWGPSGKTVFERTYSRTKPDGSKETWQDTVNRVVVGNLGLVHGDMADWNQSTLDESAELFKLIHDFRIIPAGRHLWASGVKGRQYLMNCWTSGWGEKLSDHFEFTFLRLMEGGGVGANYSSNYLVPFGLPKRELDVHIVCSPDHPDHQAMLDDGVLSTEYSHEWEGAFEVADSREGWASALVDLIDTFMTEEPVKHRQRVYDVSNVRGKGARLKTFGGTASGPLPFATMMHKVGEVLSFANRQRSFTQNGGETWTFAQHLTPMDAMEIDHAIAECVVSGGNRRSARMSIVKWHDPFIHEFINSKMDKSKHWTTNISVEIDDQFIAALGKNSKVGHQATEVHQAVVAGMLLNGEPGYWNSSLSNHGEIVPVYATNPCGEITLQMWEACNLGHVNLDPFAPKTSGDSWDEGGLIRAQELMTRFLLRATYADINDPKSRLVQDDNRRIGVGHFGVQGFIVKNGWRYSDVAVNPQTREYHIFRRLIGDLHAVSRNTGRSYAFELRIPEPVKVTCMAPTGSIAKLAGATEGGQTIFSPYFEQRIRFSMADPAQVQTVLDAAAAGLVTEVDSYDESGFTEIVVYPTKHILVEQVEQMGYDPLIVESAGDLPLGVMLAFQEMYQTHYCDNAMSFTVNVKPGLDHKTVADTIQYWLPALKGTTIMVDESRPQSPYTRITKEAYEAAVVKVVEDSTDLDCSTGACPIR